MPDEPMTAPDPTAPAARPGAGGGAIPDWSDWPDAEWLAPHFRKEIAACRTMRDLRATAENILGCVESLRARVRSDREKIAALRALAAPPAPACDCASCRAARENRSPYSCCPQRLTHGAFCICGATIAEAPPAPAPAGEAERDRLALEIAAEAAYTTGYLDGVDAAARHADDDYEHRRATAESRAIAYVDARPLLRTAPEAPGAADARAREAWLEDAVRDFLDCHDTGCIESEGQALAVLRTAFAARRAAGEGRNASGRETGSVAGPAPSRSAVTPVGPRPGEAAALRCTTRTTGPNAGGESDA